MENAVILVTRHGMGSADPELQLKLFATYMKLLLENGKLPGAICFYTDGVKLAVEGRGCPTLSGRACKPPRGGQRAGCNHPPVLSAVERRERILLPARRQPLRFQALDARSPRTCCSGAPVNRCRTGNAVG